MNAQCYRVIFNKARGMLMVVSESARAQGKKGNPANGGSTISQVAGTSQTAGQSDRQGCYQGGQLMPLRAQLLLALGLATIVGSSAYADTTNIVADRNAAAAQQATILKASNGITQVNIRTPSAAGVSRNVFSNFDVGKEGAVLNNSRTNAQTQLAGWVEGNPHLARGGAKVILNEVNSSDPSRLSGYTEIAGNRAELVIANPSGITCAGCGFINASRTTLTTGQALMDQGKLTGFDVRTGNIRVDGEGIDTSGSDYTQIISKTAEINAGIYAKNLDVITGSNQVSYEEDATNTVVTASNTDKNSATNKATGVALDVSALGAMYAGKIRLIGTDKGMGVTNAGSIVASAGGLQLDHRGNLINSGSMIANQGSVDITTHNAKVDNSGTIASSRDTVNVTSGSLTNSGVISSRDTLKLQQTGSINNSGEIASGSFDIKSAALNNSGSLLQTGLGALAIGTSQLINKQGGIIGQDLYPSDSNTPPSVTPPKTPPTTANNGSSVGTNPNSQPAEPNPVPLPSVTRDGNINAGSLTNTGSIYTNGKISASADSVVNQGKSSLAVSTLNIADKGSIANTDSRLQLDQIDWQLASFDNSKGQVITNGGITLDAENGINNTQGVLASNGNIALKTKGDINNNAGLIQSNANLSTDSGSLNNNNGKLISQSAVTINSRGDITNTKGEISSVKDTTIISKSLDNDSGQIMAQGSLTTGSESLNNSGQLYGKTETQITTTGAINNSGLIGSGGDAFITAGSLAQANNGSLVAGMNADGKLAKNRANLKVTTSGNITSQGNHIATGDVLLTGDNINLASSNTQGSRIKTAARTGLNTTKATITATDTLTLSSADGILDNTAGNLRGGVLEIDAKRLNNTGGSLIQTGTKDLTLALVDGIDNTRGEIASNSTNLTLNTSVLNNSSGKITHAGQSATDGGRLSINADSVNNTDGEILSLGTQTWQIGQDISNTAGAVQAKRFDITAQNIDNTDGRIVAVNNTKDATKDTAKNTTSSSNSQLQARANLTNAGKGVIASDTGGLTLTATRLDNDKGQISSVNDLSIKTNTLTNSGSLYSQGNVDVANRGKLTNSGSIAAQGNTAVKTASLTQTATGQLIAGLTPESKFSNIPSHVTVNSTGQQVNAGTTIATGNIKMQGSELDLTGGLTQGINIDIQADQRLINKNGLITGDNVSLKAQQIDNSSGDLVAANTLSLNSNLLNNELGEIRHLGASPLTLTINDLKNHSGYIGSNAKDLTITSSTLNNTQGLIQHSGTGALNIESSQLQGGEGEIITASTLNLSGNTIDLSKASTQAGSLQLTANTLNNQAGTLILTNKVKDSFINVQQLNNADGRIASQNQTMKIKAGDIDNTAGDIFSNNELKVNANQLTNEKGVLASKSNILLDISGKLNNKSGLINSEKSLAISADSLNNDGTLGQSDLGILADSIALDVNTLSNQIGVIEAKEQVNISAETGIDNSNGLMASGGDLSIVASNIDNRKLDIINKDGSLFANKTNDIVARSISGDGSILSFQDITVDTTEGFNHSKKVSANGNIVFKTQGDFINQGSIEAGDSVNITAVKNLDNFNKIQGSQNVSLMAKNVTNHNNGQVIASNNKVQAKDTLTNKGSIEGISTLTIDAGSVDNSGKLITEANSGKLTINVTNTIQNTGLINAGKLVIRADELLNSEKIFGGDIAIQANILVNGKDMTAALSNVNGGNTTSGSIASRGNLALAGNTILNEEGALIYVQGDLSVGGSLDAAGKNTGSATSLTNASADIRVAGNASLNAKDINNENRHLTTTTKVTQDPNTKMVFSETLDSKEYAADEIRLWRTWNRNNPNETAFNDDATDFGWLNEIDGTKTFDAQWGVELPDGKQITEHVSRRFKETMSETSVSSSDPGSISIGGNLVFSDNLTNKDSKIIVGGSVNSTSGNSVQNISTEGERVLERNGTQLQYRIERDNNGVKSSRWESRQNEGSYSDSIKTTFDLDTTTFTKNSKVDVAQQDIEKTEVDNSATELVQDNGIKQRDIVNDLGSNEVANVTGNTQISSPKEIKNTDNVAVDINKATLEGSSARNQAINEQKQDSITVQNSNPQLPTNSLFGINPDSNAKYLVEADPAFSNYNKWLSSDYMLDRLQLDPTVTQKRLGDGFYEQFLIQDQIHQLTGYQFLGNYKDDQSQYQMLMDNGLTFAQDHNLRAGIALSASQVAQLTSDIVWLVEQTVILENGKTVTALVPKVYLRPDGLSVRPNGALFSAGEGLNLNLSEDFENVSGVVMGRNIMNINARNVDNMSGLLTSDIVNINAVEDINNMGGEVRANTALSTNAGIDINVESTTQSSNNGKRVNLDRIAGFYVDDKLKGRLQATAGRNINLAAANIDNAAEQGIIVLDAGKDINLGTVKTGFSESLYVDEDNQRNVKVINEVGSNITGKGSIGLRAGDNIRVRDGNVKSKQGTVDVSAGKDVTVDNSISTESVVSKFKYQVRGRIAREEVKNVDTKNNQTNNKSIFEGNSVSIDSKNGNVSLINADIKASEEARVTAMNGKVTLQSAVDQENLSYNESTTSFYKETGHQQGYEREILSESGISGASVYVNGKNVDVNAANLQARDGNLQVGDATLATDTQGNLKLDENGKPIVQAGSIDNLTFGTIELEDNEWNNKQKSYKGIAKVGMQVAGVVGGALGIADGITISKSSEDTSNNTREAASKLEGNNILVGGNTVKADGTTFNTRQASGGSTFILGNNVDLGVATNTSTNIQKRQEETIGGEGIRLNSDSLQLGAVVRTDTKDKTTTTATSHQGVTVDSDNITVLGNMTDGSLTTKAAKFNANEKTGSLLLGAKTTNLGGIENTETVTNNNKTDTTRLSVNVHHSAVDTISAAEQVKEAGSAVAAAKNELSDAKDRASRGELSQSAVKDYEINLAATTLNLANAQINLGSTATGAANTAATAGFSATAKAEHTQTTSTDTQSKGEWQGTELNGANATFVGDDFTGTGLKGNIGKLNVDNLGSFTLNAGTNTSSSNSNSKTNSQTGSISTTGNASLGVSQQQSSAQSQGNTYTNSELNVGEFNGYAGTTNLTGGRINAGGGSYATDKLNIETVQNSSSSSDKSSGGNLGINLAGSAPNGGSIGANQSKGNSQSLIATEQSGIVYSSDNHSLTAGSTTNIGGILANINTDSDGNQTNGALNFTTGSLNTKDLINTATEEQRSIGGILSTGKTATGVSLNNVGIQLGNTGRDFESVTRATIGQGAIVTEDTRTGKDSLAGVNRDSLNTETITKDVQTGGLAVDTGIDTRVLTQAGRDEIAKEQKGLGKNVNTTGKITAAAGIQGAATAGNIITGNQNISQAIQGAKTPSQMAKVIQDHPEVGAVLQSYQQGDYDGLLNSQAALQILSDSTGVSVDVIITSLTNQLRARGTTDGQLVAIDSDVSNRKDVIKTTAHELDHVRGGSSEYLADLAGIAADLNVSASMDAKQDKINSYKPALGDGRDAATQRENEQLLGQNDEKLITALDKDPESFDYATSYKQDFQYLGRFVDNDTAKAYMAIDKSQEQAHFKGSQAAFNEFGKSIVDAPANIKALYEATKDDPVAVAVEVGKALKNLPEEYYDMGKDITYASLLGNKDQDFYNAGKASTAIALDAVSSIISAGGAVVVKKVGGKVTGIEFKFPRKKPNRSDTNGTHDTGTGKNVNNKTNSQNTNTIGNDNYFDSFGNNAPYTRDYSAELQASINKQKAKNDKFDAEMKAADAKREAEWTKIQAETNALLASSNELLKEVEVDRRINDRVAEADRIMDDFNRSKTSQTVNINSVPDFVIRKDNDFFSQTNYKGKPKAYINEKGDLVPANLNGTGSIQTHIRGGDSGNSPHISTTDPSSTNNSKQYGSDQVFIDTRKLQEDISSGKVKGTEIITPLQVQKELSNKLSQAQTRYENNPTKKNKERRDDANRDLSHAIRDGECLIKGTIPSNCIK